MGGLFPRLPRSQVTPATVVVVVFTVLVIAGALYLLWQLNEIVQWLLVALFLAVALSPPVDWLSRGRLPRIVAILLVYLALLLGIALLGALIVPPLVDQLQELVAYVTRLARAPGGFDQTIEELANRYGLGGYADTIREQIHTLPSRLTAATGPLIVLTRSIVGSVTALVSILLLTFFLLLDSDRFTAGALELFHPAQRPRLARILTEFADAIHGYVNGNLFISVIAGLAAYIAIRVLQLPYAVALALVIALFDLIPLVGSTLGASIAVLIALLVDPPRAAILAVFFIVYQQVENNLLQPLVYGRSVKQHPLVVFVAVLVGAELLGVLGTLLAIPVAEMIRIAIAEWLASRAQAAGNGGFSGDPGAAIESAPADATDPIT